MVKVLMAKHLGSLRPIDEAGEIVLQGMAMQAVVEVEIRRIRNVQHHRLFWALMSLVWEQIDDKERFPTVEDLVTEVKIITGHYTRRDMVVEGKRYPVLTPKSISFAAMDQTTFSAFFERCVDWVVTNILPGVSRDDLREELELMTGIKYRGNEAETLIEEE